MKIDESILTGNIDISTYIDALTYNDFTGFISKDFPPVTTKTNLFSDNILNTMLKHLSDNGQYSKDIQNITIDDKYRLKINNWKKWLEYNTKHTKELDKSMNFKYMDLFDNIQENTMNTLISRIDTFLNEKKHESYDVLDKEKKFMDSVNKFRKQFNKLNIADNVINKAVYADMNVLFNALADINSILWKKGSKTTIAFSNIGALHNKVDSKLLSAIITVLRSFEKDYKKFVDAIMNIDDGMLQQAIIKDINLLKKGVKDIKSAFWTKSSDIFMIWSNTLDYIGI